ncbi:Zinc finger, RING-CH-type [Trema orientale]|uniref:Zinc finger, RING-CH-type n=1 Tax=Trema orientale TaxID=63057 RepID=A0A2P5CBR3_TREOI|nr:Zinc finger, RING-CH-type [Trema orientale]
MGDHFALLVDRLLTESTLEAAIERENQLQKSMPFASQDNMISSHKIDMNISSSSGKLVECRICHDEDEDLNMETPCSCRGSLKYAHRKCVQRWCNEKGDIICEICHQQFEPGYTAPPPLFHYGGVPMNFRGNWEISRRDLHNTQFLGMVTPDRDYVDTEFDEYPVPSPRSVMCCRIVAIIFMVLLVLRHTLPIIISGAGEYSMTLFMLLVLRTIGILLPIFIMVRAFTSIQRHRHQQARVAGSLLCGFGRQDSHISLASSDEENELPHPRPRFVQIR